jgi:protein-tyrosine phosphatase
MLRWVRGKVSGPRNRYIDESSNLDLDLTYVTPQVIAMGLPSSGVESLYRTPITEVSRFLDEQHFGRYLVFNVSEREYDCRHFHNRVVMAPFPDHEPPPLRLIWHLAHAAEAWLAVDKRNVIVVHCVAGKGRTGVLVSCYLALAASRRAASAYAAGEGGAAAPPAPDELAATMMDLFRSVRGDGVRHRSQQRYVRYFCALAAAQYGGGDGGRGRADAAVDTGAAADIAAPPVAAAGDSGKDGDDGDGGAAAASHRRERSIAVVECAAWPPAAEEPSCAPPFAWLPPGLSQVDVNGREVRVVSVKAAAAGEALQWMFRVRNADRSKDESKHEIVFAASFEPAGREGSAAVDIVVAHARVRGRGRFTAPCAGALVLRFDNSAAWRGVKSVLLALSPDPYLRSLRRRASLACDEFGPDEEEEGVEAGGGGGAFDPRPAVATVNLPAALPTPSPTPSPAAVPAAGSAAASASARSSTGSAAAATPPPPTKEEELLALHRWRRVVERGPSAAVAPLPPLLRRSTRVYPHPAADIDAPPRLRLHRLVVSGLHVDPTLPLPVAGEVVQQIAPLVCHLEAIPHTGASEKISTTPAAAPTTVRRLLALLYTVTFYANHAHTLTRSP